MSAEYLESVSVSSKVLVSLDLQLRLACQMFTSLGIVFLDTKLGNYGETLFHFSTAQTMFLLPYIYSMSAVSYRAVALRDTRDRSSISVSFLLAP